MRGWLPLWVVATACSSGSGVAVEIATDDMSIDRVEVWIAPDSCSPGEGLAACSETLAWDTAPGPQTGKVFFLDADAPPTVFARESDGRLGFELVSEDGADRVISRIVIVGLRGSEPVAVARLKHVTIPGARAEKWTVRLDEVAAIPAGDPPITDGYRVHTWSRAENRGCLVFEDWNPDNVSRDFLVSSLDADCDSYLNSDLAECNPFWFDFTTIDIPSNTRCATPDPDGPPACVVGTGACVRDGSATCTQVMPEKCLPDVFCEHTDCKTLDPVCLRQVISEPQLANAPYYECVFPTDSVGDRCANFTNGIIGLPEAVCDLAGFIDITVFDDAPKASFTLGLETKLKLNQVADGQCTFEVLWEAGRRPVAGTQTGFVAFQIKATKRVLAIPIKIVFEGGPQSSCPTAGVEICQGFLGDANGGLPDGVFSCRL